MRRLEESRGIEQKLTCVFMSTNLSASLFFGAWMPTALSPHPTSAFLERKAAALHSIPDSFFSQRNRFHLELMQKFLARFPSQINHFPGFSLGFHLARIFCWHPLAWKFPPIQSSNHHNWLPIEPMGLAYLPTIAVKINLPYMDPIGYVSCVVSFGRTETFISWSVELSSSWATIQR